MNSFQAEALTFRAKIAIIFIAILTLHGLTGCAAPAPQQAPTVAQTTLQATPPDSTSATPASTEAIAPLAFSTAQGRLSVTVGGDAPQSLHAGFRLVYDRAVQAGRLALFSPLGQTLGELTWSANFARVLQGGQVQTYPSVEAMLQAHTGAALPLDALLDWLEGRATPSPGWQVDLSRHADGRINATRSDPQPPVQLRVILEAP